MNKSPTTIRRERQEKRREEKKLIHKKKYLTPCERNGQRFKNLVKMKRYEKLVKLEKSGRIKDFKLDPEFIIEFNNTIIVKYYFDFSYIQNKVTVVETVAPYGFRGDPWMARKLMKAFLNATLSFF